MNTLPFASLLYHHRIRRRLSQSELGKAAGFDHSSISRWEMGTRFPTRDAVTRLSSAMGLAEAERDTLLASAGILPDDINNLFATEPVIGELATFLTDQTIPDEVRDDVRHMIQLLLQQAQRSQRHLTIAAD